MKTPRDILLARHQAAAPKLDAIRQSTVEAVCDRRILADNTQDRRSQTAATTAVLTLWRELIFPCRRIWAGLATAWVLLAAINIAQRDQTSTQSISTAPATTSFREQQRLLNELFADSTPAATVETIRPKTFSPKPRTEKIQLRTV